MGFMAAWPSLPRTPQVLNDIRTANVTTDLVNLYNRNIFKTSLYIYIFQDEKCRRIQPIVSE